MKSIRIPDRSYESLLEDIKRFDECVVSLRSTKLSECERETLRGQRNLAGARVVGTMAIALGIDAD